MAWGGTHPTHECERSCCVTFRPCICCGREHCTQSVVHAMYTAWVPLQNAPKLSDMAPEQQNPSPWYILQNEHASRPSLSSDVIG